MWPYWLMFVFPVLAAMRNSRIELGQLATAKRFNLNSAWRILAVVYALLIGYRYRVGGDWNNYIRRLEQIRSKELADVLSWDNDPGYHFLGWLSHNQDWGIFGVNLICAIIFSFGLLVFCRNLPRPWLALAVATPYLITVVAMGYTRQGIAIGLAMLGLVALGRQEPARFVFWVLLGAIFHKSAVLLLPIAALAATRKRVWTAVWVAVVVAGAYILLLEKSVDTLYSGYIETEYQSQGALIRLSMNAVPAAILLIWWRHFEMTLSQRRLWLWFALISLALFLGYFVTPASTALDRVALYMIPLQLCVFSYLPEVFGTRHGRNTLFTAVVLIYYAAVLFVWINFATHATYWVPYRNWLFM